MTLISISFPQIEDLSQNSHFLVSPTQTTSTGGVASIISFSLLATSLHCHQKSADDVKTTSGMILLCTPDTELLM